ncbi:T9SS type B sorting domain-containing protein, partial [Flavobacterium sp. F372]
TFNYTVTTTGGCPPATTTGTITVTPNNTVTAASTAPTLCVNTALTAITHTTTGGTGIGAATGLPAGVTASWAANTITISGSPTATGTFNYTIPLTGGCGLFNATGTITVTPNNTVTAASSSPTLCVNTALTAITHTTTGATGIGAATGLPAGVTAIWAANTITISGSPTATGTFNYTIPLTGGCGVVNATGTITVSELPTANISYGATSYCYDAANTNVTLVGTGPYTGGSFSAIPSGLVINAVTGEISPSTSTAGTYTVRYLVPANGGCSSYFVTTTVTIIPKPVLTYTVTNPMCNGNFLDFNTPPGSTYTWVASNNDLSGFPTSGDQTNINSQLVQLIDPMSTTGSISMIIVPTSNGCTGDPISITILVNPKPRIKTITQDDKVLCSGETLHMDVTGEPSGLTYNWTVYSNNGVIITSGVNSGTTTGAIDLQLTTANPMQQGQIQFQITPIRNGCSGTPVLSDVIIVNPIPGNPIGLPQPAICSGETTNINVSENLLIPNTQLQWQVVASDNVTGYTNGIGLAPISINDILVNSSNVQGFVTYRITSILGECGGGFTDITVLVNPLPKPVLTDGYICVNATTGLTYQGYLLDTQLSDPSFTYDWFLLDTTTNTYEPIAGANASTYLAMVEGNYQVIVTNSITNCYDDASADVIEVFPATAFTATVTEAFTDNPTITITVNPIGTGSLIYALDDGAWQESNVFTGVEAGTHTVLVSDLEGCTNLSIEVIVIDYPKYFTPNGDGIHDTWNIIGLNQADAKLYIFDRYGKLIKQISVTDESKGWDGTYNGAQLPSTDYWFTLDFTENKQQKQFKSHFSLKR